MQLPTMLPRLALASFAFAMLATTSANAEITVTSARIAAGKLLITGTAAAPNSRIRLDGKSGAEFTVTSKADKTFRFSLVYLPDDCIVSLQQVVGAAGVGPATDLVVANCGRAGVSPRGAWNQTAPYLTNDLVTHQGSTWRAKRENAGQQPAEGADWEQFAAKGERGPKGADGGTGGTGRGISEVAPTGPAGGDLAGTYPNPSIRNGAVTAAKIGIGAVTGFKLAPNSVNSLKIVDGAVRNSDLAADAVTDIKILNGAVTSAKVLDESLTDVDLAPNSVTSSEIATDAVQASEIADNSIDSGEIVDNSLFSNDLGFGSVRGSELGTITQRSQVSANIPAGGNGSVTATCLAGERMISGGNDGFFDVFVVASRQSGNGWAVFAHNNSGGNRTITAHVYCLQAS